MTMGLYNICKICFIFAILFQAVSSDARCPTGWKQFDQKCFHFNGTDQTYEETERYCKSLNATMVTIHSQEENNFITSLLPKGTGAWLGASVTGSGFSTFKWFDRSVANYTKWGSGEHSSCNGGMRCCKIEIFSHGYWYVSQCLTGLYQLCQKSSMAESIVNQTFVSDVCIVEIVDLKNLTQNQMSVLHNSSVEFHEMQSNILKELQFNMTLLKKAFESMAYSLNDNVKNLTDKIKKNLNSNCNVSKYQSSMRNNHIISEPLILHLQQLNDNVNKSLQEIERTVDALWRQNNDLKAACITFGYVITIILIMMMSAIVSFIFYINRNIKKSKIDDYYSVIPLKK